MEQLINERLQDNLQRLKMTRAVEVLDDIVKEAERDKSSYLAFLDHLLEEEVAAKEKRRVHSPIHPARAVCPVGGRRGDRRGSLLLAVSRL